MAFHTLIRAPDGDRLTALLNQQRRHGSHGKFCDVVLQLLATGDDDGHQRTTVPANFCVLAPHSSFIGDRYFADGNVPFSVHNPLVVELTADGHQCEQCLRSAVDFVYDEPVHVEVGSAHVQHLRDLGTILGLADLLAVLERVADMKTTAANELRQPAAAETLHTTLAVIADEQQLVLQYEEVPEKLLSRAGAFQYKAQTPSTASVAGKKHPCPGCPFKCYRPAEMIDHMQSACPTPSTRCNLCDTQFGGTDAFLAHLPRHTLDPATPFYCTDCDQRFATKTALALHTPKHSPAAPHHCTDCDKRFKWKHGLRNHQATHGTAALLLCDECGFSTAHLKTLRAHQLGHKGAAYRCLVPQCAYTSRRKENLRTHLATHRNETPFVCEVCGHRFSQSKNLKRHALVHVARDRHRCPHCDFSNYRTDKLKEHIVRQHTERPLQLELEEHVQSELLLEVEAEEPEVAGGQVKRVRRSAAKTSKSAAETGAEVKNQRDIPVKIAPKPVTR